MVSIFLGPVRIIPERLPAIHLTENVLARKVLSSQFFCLQVVFCPQLGCPENANLLTERDCIFCQFVVYLG